MKPLILLGFYHFSVNSTRVPKGRGFLMKLAQNLAQAVLCAVLRPFFERRWLSASQGVQKAKVPFRVVNLTRNVAANVLTVCPKWFMHCLANIGDFHLSCQPVPIHIENRPLHKRTIVQRHRIGRKHKFVLQLHSAKCGLDPDSRIIRYHASRKVQTLGTSVSIDYGFSCPT